MTREPSDRIDDDPSAYAEYLRSPLGRLRTELVWTHLQSYLPPRHAAPLRAVDLGTGTGEMALRLAAAGWHVTAVDRAPRMLARAAEAASARGLRDRIECRTLDLNGGGLSSHVARSAFDLVLCHNVLEYIESPEALLREALGWLNLRGRVSIVVRTRAGEVLKHAIRGGDLDLSARLLASSHVRDDLYGLDLRLFDVGELGRLLSDVGLDVVAQRGVRVVADYLPDWTRAGEDAFVRVLALERRLAEKPEFCSVARHLQVIAARGGEPLARASLP
jgi:S-adenosylmethionine-dependent methyltransferase